MLFGFLFHEAVDAIAFVAPYLIFVMLLITFCRVKFDSLRIDGCTMALLCVQLAGAIALYLLLLPVNAIVAQGAFICVFCPTATAAPVVTHMLGGDINRLVSFSLLSNAVAALTAPTLFTMIGDSELSLLGGTLSIARHVVPLILIPLLVAIVLRRTAPAVHRTIAEHQSLSFYIWAVALLIVVGRAVSFILKQPTECIPVMIWLAVASLGTCILQFAVGRLIGKRYGDTISAAQGLGQKNTVLAIWMALTYLNPLSSVAPAAYVAWQNTINSLQLFVKVRREQHTALNS